MSSAIGKSIRRSVPILRKYCIFKSEHECTFSYYIQKKDNIRPSKIGYAIPMRTITSSNLSKSNDTNDENNSKDDMHQKMLDDPEVRDILSDFAKDFDVGSDSEQVLDEIRKSLDESESKASLGESKSHPKSNLGLKEKFKEFSDEDSTVIPSSEELQTNKEYFYHISQDTESDASATEVDLKRGIWGVYDIEQIVDVLKRENLDDIAVISVPKELRYTDYLVIVTAKSPRHAKAVCERVIKLYKLKKHSKDPFVIVEGEKTPDWKVIDMGNIVLHVFLEETRELYDIESLWLFDTAFDKGGNMKDDSMYPAIERHMEFFNLINAALSNSKQKTV